MSQSQSLLFLHTHKMVTTIGPVDKEKHNPFLQVEYSSFNLKQNVIFAICFKWTIKVLHTTIDTIN